MNFDELRAAMAVYVKEKTGGVQVLHIAKAPNLRTLFNAVGKSAADAFKKESDDRYETAMKKKKSLPEHDDATRKMQLRYLNALTLQPCESKKQGHILLAAQPPTLLYNRP